MGHFIFICLHFLAIMFGFFGLIITIPLHIIYATQKGKAEREAIALKARLAEEKKLNEEKRFQKAVEAALEKQAEKQRQNAG